MAKKNKINYSNLLIDKKVPILTLDSRWHALFSNEGKPVSIQRLESRVNSLLKEQGRLIQDIKALKSHKTRLMNEIIEQMPDGKSNLTNIASGKTNENRRLIEEINQKVALDSEKLGKLPYEIREANELLVIEGIKFFYEKLENGKDDIERISVWIESTRQKLKDNIIRKQELEESNTKVYSYMHDVLGSDIMERFDANQGSFLNKKRKKRK